jgi:hypothetical protein
MLEGEQESWPALVFRQHVLEQHMLWQANAAVGHSCRESAYSPMLEMLLGILCAGASVDAPVLCRAHG